MAWPSFFRRQKKDTCRVWGYSFQVTPQHLTKDDTAAMKMSYDTLGEAALNRLNFLYPPGKEMQYDPQPPKSTAAKTDLSPARHGPHKRDLFVLLRDHATDDDVLRELWTQVNTVPNWVCWEQIGRGQEVFYRYGGPALTGLAFQSLLGGMVRQKEVEDYISLFRYIAYLTGTPHEFFESPAKAKTIMETLLRDEIDPSPTSRILANNILNCLEGQSPTFPSRAFLEANCR
ncbi:MAG: hypothetical protein Q9170_007989, partial [Blastenia crenularia]